MYPLEPNLVALGLVVGLDYHDAVARRARSAAADEDAFRSSAPYLEGGEMMEWGAKTIPEGGYHALPKRRHGDGVMIVGDAAGFVEVASLKGIHYAMQSGMFAARAMFAALKAGDTSAAALAPYDRAVDESYIVKDLYERRNMRLVFQKDGFYVGGAEAALMTLTRGAFPGGHIRAAADADVARQARGRSARGRGRQADLQQGGRGVQVGQRHARRHPFASDRGRRRAGGGGRVVRPHVPGRRVRGVGRPAGGERAQLHRLQGDRRARAALDATRRRQRPPLPAHVT